MDPSPVRDQYPHVDSTDLPFRVIFVCTGNICRSPIAEQVFRSIYPSQSVQFSSAGVHALAGHPMPGQAAAISTRLGGKPDQHAGRQLTPRILADADLVVALSRGHRSEIVRTLPRANRYTFTLRELARLLESLTREFQPSMVDASLSVADRLRSVVPLIAGERGRATPPESPEEDDVIDPYRRSQSIYDQTEDEIVDSVSRIYQSVRAMMH